MDARNAAARNGCCFRRVICRCDGVHFHAALLSSRPSLPVARHAPDDTCQVPLFVITLMPRPLLVQAQKRFLHYVVYIAAVAQERPGHTEGEAEVAFDERLEGGFVCA